MKNTNNSSVFSTLLLFATLALSSSNTVAQDLDDVTGTYTIVSSAPFGNNPRGQLILGRDGYYSLVLARATLAKIAAGARGKGTADENNEIVGGSIAHVGKYTMDSKSKTITFNVELSTFPNWDGTTITRAYKISKDQFTYTNNTPSDGSAATEVVWKRVR